MHENYSISKPSRNSKCVSEAKLSINLALNVMKKDSFFCYDTLKNFSITQRFFFSASILEINLSAVKGIKYFSTISIKINFKEALCFLNQCIKCPLYRINYL